MVQMALKSPQTTRNRTTFLMNTNRIGRSVLALLSGLLIATTRAATVPAVGEMAPDFKLKDLEACEVQLSDLTTKSDVVLVVLRGWPGYQCPACTQQGHDFVKNAAKLKKAGAHVIIVYPGPA